MVLSSNHGPFDYVHLATVVCARRTLLAPFARTAQGCPPHPASHSMLVVAGMACSSTFTPEEGGAPVPGLFGTPALDSSVVDSGVDNGATLALTRDGSPSGAVSDRCAQRRMANIALS